jgi:hypothetical protein
MASSLIQVNPDLMKARIAQVEDELRIAREELANTRPQEPVFGRVGDSVPQVWWGVQLRRNQNRQRHRRALVRHRGRQPVFPARHPTRGLAGANGLDRRAQLGPDRGDLMRTWIEVDILFWTAVFVLWEVVA